MDAGGKGGSRLHEAGSLICVISLGPVVLVLARGVKLRDLAIVQLRVF